jgi:hypothetical protein
VVDQFKQAVCHFISLLLSAVGSSNEKMTLQRLHFVGKELLPFCRNSEDSSGQVIALVSLRLFATRILEPLSLRTMVMSSEAVTATASVEHVKEKRLPEWRRRRRPIKDQECEKRYIQIHQLVHRCKRLGRRRHRRHPPPRLPAVEAADGLSPLWVDCDPIC